MTLRAVRPGRARGRIRAPPSKSYTHRALVAAHLARRPTAVERPLDADDTRATARALVAFGSRVVRGGRVWSVRPSGRSPRRRRIDCGASGTTLRLAVALAAREGRATEFTGTARLGARPMEELLRALRTLGAECTATGRSGGLPLRVCGPIEGGSLALDASESSQFTSALLFVLPTCRRGSTLRLRGRIVSAPYIEATRAVLRFHGIRVHGSGSRLRLPGGQAYSGARFRVPGDASSAAYLWSAAALTGGDVRVDGLPVAWPQADLAILSILDRLGARVDRTGDSVRVRGGARRAFSVDLTDCPDLYPLAGVLAASALGRSRLRGAAHAALKESDRRAATVRLARALGASVKLRAGGLDIVGDGRPRGFTLRGLDDHRLVMSAAVGALGADRPSRVGEAEAVAKSYPGFWSALDRLVGPGASP
jgi:3-phosphoshikimate 1-carboxyvinyltransferase